QQQDSAGRRQRHGDRRQGGLHRVLRQEQEGEFPAGRRRGGAEADCTAQPHELELHRPKPQEVSSLRSHGSGLLRCLRVRWHRDHRDADDDQLHRHGGNPDDRRAGSGETERSTEGATGPSRGPERRTQRPRRSPGAPAEQPGPYDSIGRILTHERRVTMRPTKTLALGLGIATLLATLSSPPSRALETEGSAGVAPGVRPSAATLDKTYGKLPMSFEKNAGQSRPGVDFIARGSGYSVFLTSGEAVLTVKRQRPLDAVAKQEQGGATIR